MITTSFLISYQYLNTQDNGSKIDSVDVDSTSENGDWYIFTVNNAQKTIKKQIYTKPTEKKSQNKPDRNTRDIKDKEEMV